MISSYDLVSGLTEASKLFIDLNAAKAQRDSSLPIMFIVLAAIQGEVLVQMRSIQKLVFLTCQRHPYETKNSGCQMLLDPRRQL